MSEITGPITVKLLEEDVEALKDGEQVTRELDTKLDGTSKLEITWKTVYER